MHKSRRGIFHKYIISFASFFLVPMIALSICLQVVMYRNLNSEILSFNQNILERLGDDLVIIHGRLMEAGNKISFSRAVVANNFNNKSQLDLVNALRKENGDNVYISKAYLIYQDEEVSFSSQGVYDKQMLISRQLRLEEGEREEFLTKLYATEKPRYDVIMKQYSQKEGIVSRPQIVFIYPVSNYSNRLVSWLVFELQDSKMKLDLATTAGEYSRGIAVCDQDGRELITKNADMTGRKSEISDSALREQILKAPPGVCTLVETDAGVYGKTSGALIYPLGGPGLTLVNWIAMPNPLSAVVNNHSPLVAGVLGFLLLGCVLAVYTAYYYYRPIHQLAQYMRKEDETVTAGEKDELDYIKGQYDSVNSIRESLAKEIESQWPLVEERLVTKLLHDGAWELADGDIVAKVFEEQMSTQAHFVALAVKKNRAGAPLSNDYQAKREALSVRFGSRYTANSTYIYDYEAVGLIVGAASLSEEDRREVGQVLKEVFRKEDCIVCMGNIYEDLAGIHVSFLEALTAVKYQLLNPHMEYHLDEAGQKDGEAYSQKLSIYQTECLLGISRCLDQADPGEVARCVSEAVLSLEELPGQMAMMCCYDIISYLMKEVRNRGIPMSESELFKLTSFRTVEEFGEKLQDTLLKSCRDIQEARAGEQSKEVQQILKYLDENYRDPSLNLVGMSEHFGYSSSYMSRLISQNLEKSFSELVSERRLSYTKDCLVHTDRQIAQIAQEAGYVNLSNFTRRFKASENMTPGQYRSLYGARPEG